MSPELTTVTYTGDTTSNTNAVTLSAGVVEQADGFPGDLTKATVTFREGLTTLCSTTVGGSCTAQLDEGTHTIDIEVGGSYYTGDGNGSVTVDLPDPPTVINSGDATVQYTESPPRYGLRHRSGHPVIRPDRDRVPASRTGSRSPRSTWNLDAHREG